MTLTRKTPLKPGGKPLERRTPMKRGTVPLVAKKPMARGTAQLARQSKPIRKKSRRNADPRPKTGEAELVRGEPCYLLLPGIERHDPATVVPCHSNQSIHGKGAGIKAHDKFTVPGCWLCHMELDQGQRFTREEKFAFWNRAYERWEPRREQLAKEKMALAAQTL